MFISLRLERKLTCPKEEHNHEEISYVLGYMNFLFKERFLCKQCTKRYLGVSSLWSCSLLEEKIQDVQNQFFERICVVICQYIFQIIKLQQYLQRRGDIQNSNDKSLEIFAQWQAELTKIGALNSYYSFKKVVENFCYFYQIYRKVKHGIQFLYQRKYQNNIQAINQCNFYYFSKLSQIFKCLRQCPKICQQPACQFLFYTFEDEDDERDIDQIVFCCPQLGFCPPLILSLKKGKKKKQTQLFLNQEALLNLIIYEMEKDDFGVKILKQL